MLRPLALRMAPPKLKTALYYRFYRNRREQFAALYEAASLHYAPGVTMRLVPTDEGHSNIAFTGMYEMELTEQITREAHKGGVLVDVGANYGYYSLLWASANPQNRVVAFEASPRNLAGLRTNIATNQLQNQIELHGVAAGKDNGKLQFSVGPSEQTGWGGLVTAPGSDTVEVEVVRLDEFWTRPTDISVLKIDVEGADTWVLEGARKLLEARRIGTIFYEQNKGRMRALNIPESDAENFLKSMNYSVELLTDPSNDVLEFRARPNRS